MHVDSPKVIVETAEQRGVFVTGYHANQATLAPKGYLTGAEWNWAKVYTDYVDDGAARARATRTSCAAASRRASSRCRPTEPRCSAEAKAKADEAKAKLTDGTLVIYKGPLKDNTGKVVIRRRAPRRPQTDIALEKMNYLVEGVVGKLNWP